MRDFQNIQNAGLSKYLICGTLKIFKMRDAQNIQNAGLSKYSKCRTLKIFNMRDDQNIQNAGLSKYSKCGTLKIFKMRDSQNIQNAGLSKYSKCGTLKMSRGKYCRHIYLLEQYCTSLTWDSSSFFMAVHVWKLRDLRHFITPSALSGYEPNCWKRKVMLYKI